jgi:hypothetical protein
VLLPQAHFANPLVSVTMSCAVQVQAIDTQVQAIDAQVQAIDARIQTIDER